MRIERNSYIDKPGFVRGNMRRITAEEYKARPCEAASLPFYKAEKTVIPDGISVFRDDEFDKESYHGADVEYFKLIHCLGSVLHPALPEGCKLMEAGVHELAGHINECYTEERVSAGELAAKMELGVYDPGLWIVIREFATNRIIASGIGEYDARIGEGILDWIQVSPDCRRRGLGKFIVCELLHRLSEKADFVTVSGRIDNECNPFALYCSCGFSHPVIWHVVSN